MSSRGKFWQRRALPLVLAVLVSVGLSGCNKMRASMKAGKYGKLNDKAASYNLMVHRQENEQFRNQVDQADNLYNDGQNSFTQQDFEGALQQLTQAVDIEKQVLTQVRELEAQKQWLRAEVELQVADGNDARDREAGIYEEIIAIRTKAQKHREKQKHDKVIEESKQIIELVDRILSPLRNIAGTEIENAKAKQQEMINAGAPEHAPEYVTKVEGFIQLANEQFSFEVRKYDIARSRAQDAYNAAQEGITATHRKLSRDALNIIENLLQTAEELNAVFWVPERWRSNFEGYLEADVEHQRENYLRSRELAKGLEPKVEAMIEETRRLRAADARARLEKELAKLIAEQAKLYLESQVMAIEDVRDNAKALYDIKEYPTVEAECAKGLEMCLATRVAFDNYTATEIRKGRTEFFIAKDVFDQMQDVFIIKTSEYRTRIDMEFENNKKALMENLRSTLLTIDQHLTNAEELRALAQRYHDAIQEAREQARRANEVLASTYNVVAHNAINEVADQLSRWEKDGGREWAAEEVTTCREALDRAIELRNLRRYEDAIRQSADARGKLDFAIQKIEQKAIKEIGAAEAAIAEAKEQRAQTYEAAAFRQAESLYQEAQSKLAEDHLKESILAATSAINVSTEATKQSLQSWTNDEIRLAETEVRQAEQAGSADYAHQQLDRAQDLLATAQELREVGQQQAARLAASQAVNEARNARYARINATDEIINLVRKYGGWQYDYANLTEAIYANKQARALIAEAEEDEVNAPLKYAEANALADKGKEIANGVLDVSKLQAFDDQIVETRQALNAARNSGARFLQPSLIHEMLDEIERIEREFTIANFDTIMQETNLLNKNLKSLMESTPTVMDGSLEYQRQRLQEVEESDFAVFRKNEIEHAKHLLAVAEVEFSDKNKNYLVSYSYLKDANQLIDRLHGGVERESYYKEVSALMSEYAGINERFSYITSMKPRTLLAFAKGPGGGLRYIAIANRFTPFQFRQAIDDVLNRSRRLTPPKGEEAMQRELEHIMTRTRAAAIDFEQLSILDQYDSRTVETIINRAYKTIGDVRQLQRNLDKSLLHENITLRSAKR